MPITPAPSEKTTRKPTATRSSAARRARSGARNTTKTRRANGARTRPTNRAGSTVGQAQATTRWPISDSSAALGDYAERAVLIPVGAALIARERVVSTVNDTISRYSSASKAQAQLRRFERRGGTARNRLEREVRKVRVRVERELRQRRREIENRVSDLEDRREAVAKNGTDLANRVQERILNLV
jgi:hypothetical protein